MQNNSGQYLLKEYYKDPSDTRNRLNTEYTAFTLLHENGISKLPRPILRDGDNFALYSFIYGEKPLLTGKTEEIIPFVELIRKLYALSRKIPADSLPPAAEACFSLDALWQNISARVEKLLNIQVTAADKGETRAMLDFICGEFALYLEILRKRAKKLYRESNLKPESLLPKEEWTLSPSDMGFHNSLRLQDGSLVFVDFEYFGFDDPAKMLADFILHPGQDLSAEQKKFFLAETIKIFPNSENLKKRLMALTPLLGLKWCLILLNEFLPQSTRPFSLIKQKNMKNIRQKQLQKAKNFLKKLREDYAQ